MQGTRKTIARLQSDFYRDQFRKILAWLFVTVFIMFALIVAIIYFIFFEPSRYYFGNTIDGKILVMPRPVTG